MYTVRLNTQSAGLLSLRRDGRESVNPGVSQGKSARSAIVRSNLSCRHVEKVAITLENYERTELSSREMTRHFSFQQ